MKISVVIPVFNEERNIPELYQRLSAMMNGLGTDFEIIFVDDGSRDASVQLLDAIVGSDSTITCIKNKTHSGKDAI